MHTHMHKYRAVYPKLFYLSHCAEGIGWFCKMKNRRIKLGTFCSSYSPPKVVYITLLPFKQVKQ